MEVHSSTQHPSEIQHKVADALGLTMADVRVVVRRMGGGFGGKESQGNALAVACAVVAAMTGRPARMRYDRDDDMTITGKRHDFRIGYDVGFDADGRILGLDVTHWARCGWSMDLSLPGGRPGDAARRQRLPDPRDADHLAPPEDQHPERHRLPRLRRPAGDAGDGADRRARRPRAAPRPAGGPPPQLLRARLGRPRGRGPAPAAGSAAPTRPRSRSPGGRPRPTGWRSRTSSSTS